VANQFVTLPELKSWSGLTGSANDADLTRAIEAASQWIEGYTGRSFVLDAADVTKYFYANPDQTIDLTDLATVASIAIDTAGDRTYGTTLAASEYELLPVNGPRYDRVRIWPTSSRSFQLNPARRVRVVGRFGYVESGAVPPAVKQAALILSLRYYERRNAPFGILSATDIGQFERLSANDPDVLALLKPYLSSSPAQNWVLV